MWENTTPSPELPRDFCAGIGPLQLGVVLVVFFINMLMIKLCILISFYFFSLINTINLFYHNEVYFIYFIKGIGNFSLWSLSLNMNEINGTLTETLHKHSFEGQFLVKKTDNFYLVPVLT